MLLRPQFLQFPIATLFRLGLVLVRGALSAALVLIGAFAFANDEDKFVIRLTVVVHAVNGPNYEISVFEDGRVEYNGEVGTKVVGKARSKISRSEVQEALKQLEEIGFMGMQDKYYGPTKEQIERMKSERPKEKQTITLGLRHDVHRTIEARMRGKLKKVDFMGLAPQSLLSMARDLEQVTQAYRWTGLKANQERKQ